MIPEPTRRSHRQIKMNVGLAMGVGPRSEATRTKTAEGPGGSENRSIRVDDPSHPHRRAATPQQEDWADDSHVDAGATPPRKRGPLEFTVRREQARPMGVRGATQRPKRRLFVEIRLFDGSIKASEAHRRGDIDRSTIRANGAWPRRDLSLASRPENPGKWRWDRHAPYRGFQRCHPHHRSGDRPCSVCCPVLADGNMSLLDFWNWRSTEARRSSMMANPRVASIYAAALMALIDPPTEAVGNHAVERLRVALAEG